MPLDLHNCGKRILVRPDRIYGLLSSSWDTVVIAIAFVRTVGNAIRPFQLRKINILGWNLLNGRIRRFAERQGVAAIGDHPARDEHDNVSGITLDGNRVIWSWKLCLFFLSCFALFFPGSAFEELCDVLNKQFWVLILHHDSRRVQNELRIRQVLLEDERIHRINDHVIAAVHHERGLRDLVQVSIGIFRRRAPTSVSQLSALEQLCHLPQRHDFLSALCVVPDISFRLPGFALME